MKKLLAISAAVASISLVGCNSMNGTMNDTTRFASTAVGTGAKFTTHVVGSGMTLVGDTGAFVGRGVGTVVNTGAGLVGVKEPLGFKTVNTSKTEWMHYKGHKYMLKNGKYVRVR